MIYSLLLQKSLFNIQLYKREKVCFRALSCCRVIPWYTVNVAILIVQPLMSEKSLQLVYMYIFQVSFWNFQFINAIIMDCYQLALMVVLQRLYLGNPGRKLGVGLSCVFSTSRTGFATKLYKSAIGVACRRNDDNIYFLY